jgi:hypothetical protein
MFSALFIFTFVLTLTFGDLNITPAYAAGILYATPGGTGDCSSWANACTLKIALTGATSGDEIWVAAGTHKPTTIGTDRAITFQLKDGVALYGGFAGTESNQADRNPETNLTILSGDIDNNDSQTPIITDLATVTGNTTNSRHVVTGATGATLDGFTITAGNANGDDIYTSGSGGGMYNDYFASPTLTDVTFSGNSAASMGGGMYIRDDCSPTLTDVIFSGNSADIGGGIANYYNDGSPTLTNVTFNGNSASIIGGGMSNHDSSPTLRNVTFNGNSAGNGGGMWNYYSNPSLTNATFSDNSAYMGGGIYNYNSSSPNLKNVTFSGNSASFGGGMYNTSVSNPKIRNSIFWGNTPTQVVNTALSAPILSDSVIQDGCPAESDCTNIIIADPMLGTLGNYGGFAQTIPLLSGSSAINAGNDGVCPTTDQRGVTRPQGAHCDIGAFEVIVISAFLPFMVK